MPLTHVSAFRYPVAGIDYYSGSVDNLSTVVTSEDRKQDVHLQYYPSIPDAGVNDISCDRYHDILLSFGVQEQGSAVKTLDPKLLVLVEYSYCGIAKCFKRGGLWRDSFGEIGHRVYSSLSFCRWSRIVRKCCIRSSWLAIGERLKVSLQRYARGCYGVHLMGLTWDDSCDKKVLYKYRVGRRNYLFRINILSCHLKTIRISAF